MDGPRLTGPWTHLMHRLPLHEAWTVPKIDPIFTHTMSRILHPRKKRGQYASYDRIDQFLPFVHLSLIV